jgi:hypothetical protein
MFVRTVVAFAVLTAAEPRRLSMLNRREFFSLTGGASLPLLSACTAEVPDDYAQAAAQLRAALAEDPGWPELIRFATLAANSHNTQPWRFRPRPSGVSILPDFSRRTPVADPDDHHLYVSLGCAAENLLVAALARGLRGATSFDPVVGDHLDVEFETVNPTAEDLYGAVPMRQSTRSVYDGRSVPGADIQRLEEAAAVDGVAMVVITDKARLNQVADFVIAGNSAQLESSDFVRELGEWIRFHPSEAIRTGDGLFTSCSGNPTMPDWLGRRLFPWILSKDRENDKYAKQVRSSAGVAVFVGDREDKWHWVQVGRSFERFALTATALGIRHAHLNQAVEIPTVRSEFAASFGMTGRRPDLVVRFGYAKPMPMSMRRPVAQVLVHDSYKGG